MKEKKKVKYKYPNLKNITAQRKLFKYKNKLLSERFPEVEYDEFYRELFGYDTLQEKGQNNDLKFNALVLDYYTDKEQEIYPKVGIVNEDMEEYDFFVNSKSPAVITNACSYIGRRRKESNARYMYAMIIDLDYVATEKKFLNLLSMFNTNENVIKPTYLVNSGTGFHLYYIWNEPILLSKANREWIKNLEERLQRHAWNEFTSIKADNTDIQHLNITQGYRMVGTPTKLGPTFKVKAFKIGECFAFDDFDWFLERQKINKKHLKTSVELKNIDPNHLTREKAKKLYPEWYQERIVEGQKKKKWEVKRDLYDWFLGKLRDAESIEGARYFRITCLAAFARKCDVDFNEFQEDAMSLLEHLNNEEHNTEFTIDDMISAIEFYNTEYNYELTRQRLEERSRIEMPANKRNYQNQIVHLEGARAIRDIRMRAKGKKWTDTTYENNGRKPKKEQVRELLEEYPDKSLRELEKISGITKKTIIKWKKIIELENLTEE